MMAHDLAYLDPRELDPGIRDVVRLLRENGFETCDSGDGESKAEDFASGCALDVPHVFRLVRVPTQLIAEAERMRLVLDAEGVRVLPMGPDATPAIEATYDPADGRAILALSGVDDAVLARARSEKGTPCES